MFISINNKHRFVHISLLISLIHETIFEPNIQGVAKKGYLFLK